jgi:pimeloyl-ACP methyl ester carboxylesterase
MASNVQHASAEVAEGVRLHYVTAGTGPLVVFIHGFPEFWFSFRHVIPKLVRLGYRVVAPDCRGYNLSSKPAGVRAYGIDILVEDIAGLIRTLGEERASIVDHDWGAGLAWAFAMTHPEMVDKLTVLNGPHPQRLLDSMRSNPLQMFKSWYVFFFQHEQRVNRRVVDLFPRVDKKMLGGDFGSGGSDFENRRGDVRSSGCDFKNRRGDVRSSGCGFCRGKWVAPSCRAFVGRRAGEKKSTRRVDPALSRSSPLQKDKAVTANPGRTVPIRTKGAERCELW